MLAALAGDDEAVATDALQALSSSLAPKDSRFVDQYGYLTTVPLTGDEVFAAIARHVKAPETAIGKRALIDGAPGDPDGRVLRWYDIKTSWMHLLDACRSENVALKTDVGTLVMRVVTQALDGPAFARWSHVNDGFIDLGHAAKVIGLVWPAGGEALLRRLVEADISEHVVEEIVAALTVSDDPAVTRYIRDLLEAPRTRQAAAKALGRMAAGCNDRETITALARALSNEERGEVVGHLVEALAAMGPGAEPNIAAAIERTPPWTRFEMTCRLQGLGVREIADLLIEARAMDPIDEAALWEATGGDVNLMAILHAGGGRLGAFDIKRDETPPGHHELFKVLVDLTRPPVAVVSLSQVDDDNYVREPLPGQPSLIRETDLGTVCRVIVMHGSDEFSFEARPSGRWIDVPAVMTGFDRFMRELGRAERCFKLADGGSWGMFVVADGARFRELAVRLRIPIETDLDAARREGIAFVRQMVGDDSR